MGDRNRITHDFNDSSFEKLMRDMDSGKIKETNNWFMEHPAYYGTAIQQKDPRKWNSCTKCVYFRPPEPGRKIACTFPWEDPKDYDNANLEFIPCRGIRK